MDLPEGSMLTDIRARDEIRSIDDRSPLEAAVARCDQALTGLDALFREHAERIAPILRPASDEAYGRAELASDARAERVMQVEFLAERAENLGRALQELTGRVEA